MKNGFGGNGGFDPNNSARNNLNSYYKYNQTSGGKTRAKGCGFYILLIIIILLIINELFKCAN